MVLREATATTAADGQKIWFIDYLPNVALRAAMMIGKGGARWSGLLQYDSIKALGRCPTFN